MTNEKSLVFGSGEFQRIDGNGGKFFDPMSKPSLREKIEEVEKVFVPIDYDSSDNPFPHEQDQVDDFIREHYLCEPTETFRLMVQSLHEVYESRWHALSREQSLESFHSLEDE